MVCFDISEQIAKFQLTSNLLSFLLHRSRAGWNPVVVTLETAQQHPDFQAISALLAGPFGEYDVRQLFYADHCVVELISLCFVGLVALLFSSLARSCGCRWRLCC